MAHARIRANFAALPLVSEVPDSDFEDELQRRSEPIVP
jgi:hypothetical protein